MSLDNTRNRTLQLNLAISVASFALMASTVPASFFGMNLHSGMEVRLLGCNNLHAGSSKLCNTALQASTIPASSSGMDLLSGLNVCVGQACCSVTRMTVHKQQTLQMMKQCW